MTSWETPLSKVAAIVVTYRPDANKLRTLVSLLDAEGITIIVVDNGGGKSAMPRPVNQKLLLVDMGGNKGIGAAINSGVEYAQRVGVTHVVTFDQDSEPSSGMIGRLFEEFESQKKSGVKIGAVGPCFIDSRQIPPLEHPFIRLDRFGSGHRYCTTKNELIPVDTLITSGCMTSIEVLTDVGGMNHEYFVDYTDIEWCFRAKSKGFALYGVCAAQMVHELGHGASRSIFGLNLFEYSPVRRYYYARNTIATSFLPYVPVRWKVRLLAGLLLRCVTLPWAPRSDRNGFGKEMRMFLRGVTDGLRGKSGSLEKHSGSAK